jgi:hypothetical protein
VPTPVPTPEPTPAAPIRPLWFKSNQLDPVEAESYLERTLDRHDSNQLSAAGIESDNSINADRTTITLNGMRYQGGC